MFAVGERSERITPVQFACRCITNAEYQTSRRLHGRFSVVCSFDHLEPANSVCKIRQPAGAGQAPHRCLYRRAKGGGHVTSAAGCVRRPVLSHGTGILIGQLTIILLSAGASWSLVPGNFLRAANRNATLGTSKLVKILSNI